MKQLVLNVVAIVLLPALASAVDVEKDLSYELSESREVVVRASQKLQTGEVPTEEAARLGNLVERIRASHLILKERFTARQDRTASVSGKAADRHRTMADAYSKGIEEILSFSDAALQDGILSRPELDELKKVLDQMVRQKKRPTFGVLPYKNLHYPAKEPGLTSAIVPAYKGGNRTVTPDDTKNTPEAPLSKEITELAQSLQWNPVLIYEWVKNNVATEWYWGG